MVRSTRVGVALSVTVLLLTGGLVAPATGGAAAPSPPEPTAEQTIRAAQVRASRQARETGQKVLIEEMTTESVKVSATPDGRFESELASGPVRFRENGRWKEVDLTLHRRADGSVAPAAHLHDLVFAGSREAGDGDLASLDVGGTRRAMRWTGRLPEPVLDGNRATYPEVLPGIDLVVEAMMTGYEQFTIVKDRAALANYPLAQAALRLGDAASKPDGRGGLIHNSGSTPTPLMWDAAQDATGMPRNTHKVGLVRTGGGFGVAADRDWLHDPARRFPITVDPSDQSQSAYGGQDTYVKSSTTTRYYTAHELESGTQNSGGIKRIAYVNFNATPMHGATIHYANVKLWGTYAASCDNYNMLLFPANTAINSDTYWTNRPDLLDANGNNIGKDANGDAGLYAFAASGHSIRPANGVCTGQWLDHEARNVFQVAANKSLGVFAVALTPYWDNTNAYYRRFYSYDHNTHPHAIVSWSFPPTLGDRPTTPQMSCVVGTGRPVVNTDRPTLGAVYHQNENQPSNLEFEWYAADGAKIGGATAASVPASQAGSVTVPAGALADGGTYSWQVRAISNMGVASPWSPRCEFTVDVWAAPVAGCSAGLPIADGLGADFNGDGHRDTYIADPWATVGGVAEAGNVVVIDGQSGVKTVLDQGLAEVPDSAEAADRFGHATAVLDLNKDGCSDLAIGTPYENSADGTKTDSGRVDVLYGTPTGLGKGPAAESFVQGANRMPGTEASFDNVGYALAAGRTRAGEPFLIVGAPADDVSGQDSGSVTYLRSDLRILLDQAGNGQADETDDRAGWALAATADHFAVGYPGESTGPANQHAGQVCVFQHTLSNGRPALVKCVNQDSSGVDDSMEAGDSFGTAVSMAHYRAVGQADGTDSVLVVGVPGEDYSSKADTGIMQQFRVSGTAVTQLALVTQNTVAGAGSDEPGDLFGQSLLVVNTAPAAEVSATTLLVAVGAPGEDNGAVVDSGLVRVFAAGTASISGAAAVERTAGALPGTLTVREYVGLHLGGNPTELLVAAAYSGQRGVYAIRWTDLAAGNETVIRSWTPASLSLTGSVAFGYQAG